MRVVHAISTIDAEAAGPSYSVPRLCGALIAGGVDVQLAALDAAPGASAPPFARLFPYGRGPKRLGFSPQMRRWLRSEAATGRVDLMHGHGVWMMPNVYPAWACRGSNCRLVVSPRGMLTSWALRHHAARKKVFWHLLQAPALRSAVCFHATAPSEFDDIRRLGFMQPVSVIPNGIDVPAPMSKSHSGPRQLLFLGRLHEKKGIDILLRAWQIVESRFSDWDLRIAGPDEGGYLATLQALAAHLQLQHVTFCGALYGDDKTRAYQRADLFVLPTHSENFGLTVAEALAAGTPAIVTKGAPWADLERRHAGWWIDIGVDALASCLDQALALPSARLDDMGRAGRDWMQRDFSWDQVGALFTQTYRWLVDGGDRPACVREE